MSFSFLGSLASLLPGYVQGQRMAVNDNWSDLMKYNQAQQGQQANAFTEATWQPRLDMFYNSAYDSKMNTAGNFMDLMTKWWALPGMMGSSMVDSTYGPIARWQAYQNGFQLGGQNPYQQPQGGNFAYPPTNTYGG